jgi:tRNA G18 (ribose-2'-O)-methylase SpoU
MTSFTTLDDERVAPYRWVAEPRMLEGQGLFVVEGRLVVAGLLEASRPGGRWAGMVHSVLLSPAAFGQMQALCEAHPEIPAYVVPQPVMNDLVGFNIHRGCLALVRRPAGQSLGAAMVQAARLVVVLEGVNNPDNVGGIFRSAAAFGADLVVLGPACADPLYRKSVRTSMGATLDVAYACADPWPGALDLLKSGGFHVVALTTATAATPLHRLSRGHGKMALLAGGEGSGLSPAALASADERMTIPMSGRVDSLNVSTATAIALYQVSLI